MTGALPRLRLGATLAQAGGRRGALIGMTHVILGGAMPVRGSP